MIDAIENENSQSGLERPASARSRRRQSTLALAKVEPGTADVPNRNWESLPEPPSPLSRSNEPDPSPREDERRPSLLTSGERTRLDELVTRVRDVLNGYAAAGLALGEIREKQLYREDARTFESFCAKMFGYNRSHACRVIDAARISRDLAGAGCKTLPRTERQARKLLATPAAGRREIWEKAVAAATHAGSGFLSVKRLNATLNRLLPQPQPAPCEQNRFAKAFQMLLWMEKAFAAGLGEGATTDLQSFRQKLNHHLSAQPENESPNADRPKTGCPPYGRHPDFPGIEPSLDGLPSDHGIICTLIP